MEAEKLEKVRTGLKAYRIGVFCGDDCPYGGGDMCISMLASDALETIEELEKMKERARVLTLEEVEDALDTVVWVDRPLFDNTSNEYALIDAYSRKTQIVELRYPFGKDYRERADYETYGKTWRCWSARPTEEQRKAVAW